MNNVKVYDHERVDDLQRDGLMLIQDPERFCFGIDAVLLSDFAKAKRGDRVLDMGTGTAIIPILMSAKTSAEHLTGLEIQHDSVDMCRRSVALNGLEERLDIVEGDIKEAVTIFGTKSFQVVTCNPPYMIEHHGLKNPDEPKAIARHEILCNLDDVIRSASSVLVDNGHFYMVHRPFRLAEICYKMHEYGVEAKRMRLVHPYVDKEPNIVLIEGIKGSNPGIVVEKPLVVYNQPGEYTEEVLGMYGKI